MFWWMTLMTMPSDSMSWSRNAWCVALNGRNDASSTTASTWSSNRAGSTRIVFGAESPRPEAMRT